MRRVINTNLLEVAEYAIRKMEKKAFIPAGPGGAMAMAPPGMDPAAMGAAAGAMPPMDPAMMGGAPPMDPAMAGAAPPMDPAMMGGMPPMDPAMMGMDPAAMGGMPPMDPAAMAGGPVMLNLEDLREVVKEVKGGDGDSGNDEIIERLDMLEEQVGQILEALNIPEEVEQGTDTEAEIPAAEAEAAMAQDPAMLAAILGGGGGMETQANAKPKGAKLSSVVKRLRK